MKTITLTGITDGDGGTQPPITVTATSANTAIIPTPTINYTSPQTTGTLSFTPTFAGTTQPVVTITVKVVDSGSTVSAGSNTTTIGLGITVIPTGNPIQLNPIPSVQTGEPVGTQTVNFSGVNKGVSVTGTPTFTVTAISSDPTVMTVAGVTYSSPNPTGSIQLTYGGSHGTTTITVTLTLKSTTGLSCGIPSNSVVRTFTWQVG